MFHSQAGLRKPSTCPVQHLIFISFAADCEEATGIIMAPGTLLEILVYLYITSLFPVGPYSAVPWTAPQQALSTSYRDRNSPY